MARMRAWCVLLSEKQIIIGPKANSGRDRQGLICPIDRSSIRMTFERPIAGGRPSLGRPGPSLYMMSALSSLRPTQFAVGMREVSEKGKKLQARAIPPPFARRLPVVLGPEGQPYLHDGHHYAVALWRMGIECIATEIVDDLSHLDPGVFWLTMAERSWARPIDGKGIRRPFEHMPADILAMEDDPFRSLAGALRRLGCYVKAAVPYADFAWADFLRCRIARARVDSDFEAAMNEAIWLVNSGRDVQRLPGWRGYPGTGSLQSLPMLAAPSNPQ